MREAARRGRHTGHLTWRSLAGANSHRHSGTDVATPAAATPQRPRRCGDTSPGVATVGDVVATSGTAVAIPYPAALRATSAQSQLSILTSRGAGCALPGLDERLQAQQVDRPLRAAVVHEVDRFLPALVFEQDGGVVALLLEVPADRRADPFVGPVDHEPAHLLGGFELGHPHVETAGREAELDRPADIAVAVGIVRPPAGEAFDGRQCRVDVVRRRQDPDLVENVHHF